jgi:hypothetical protein
MQLKTPFLVLLLLSLAATTPANATAYTDNFLQQVLR